MIYLVVNLSLNMEARYGMIQTNMCSDNC
uniref:Uncharacterized protein n=1 Tax=Anguilla anguilla TaxID=7936 RepID=A0A0E9QWK6_ANGAN